MENRGWMKRWIPGVKTSRALLHEQREWDLMLNRSGVGRHRDRISSGGRCARTAFASRAAARTSTPDLQRREHQQDRNQADASAPSPAVLAAHQFAGILNEFFLWPWMMGHQGTPVPVEDVIEEAIRMFLQRYRCPQPKGGRRSAEGVSNSASPEAVSVPAVRSAVRKQPLRSRQTSAKRHR